MIQKILKYSFNLVLFYISKLVIKDNDIWVFGAWFGSKYSDNSRALFEFCQSKRKEIKAIWLSEDIKVVEGLKKEGFAAYLTYSFWGYYYTMKAGVGVVVTGKSDINKYVVNSKMNLINLWHGIPLKKIMFDDSITFSKKASLASKVFPFLKNTVYRYITSSSTEVKKKMVSAFRIDESKVVVTGNPRNDMLHVSIGYEQKFKTGIYLPTHRGEGKGGKVFFNLLIEDLKVLDDILVEEKMKLYVKLHFYHSNEIENIKIDFKSIEFINDEIELYSFISKMDFLITDYSSIYFDYLLLDRPIIFYPFDIEDYLMNDREFYYDYNEVTPGDKCYSLLQLIEAIKSIEEKENIYKKQRESVSKVFNKYRKDNSQRVFEFLRSNL